MTLLRYAIIVVANLACLTGCGPDAGTRLTFNGGELYYTSSVTQAEANKLGRYLVSEGFFNGNMKTVQLNKAGSTYEFRMVIKKGLEKDEEFIQIAKQMCVELEQLFGGRDVDIHLCDENLTTLRVIVTY